MQGWGGVGWNGSCRGGVGHAGWGGWCGSCTGVGGVGHAEVKWVMQGCGGSCRGGVGHVGDGWMFHAGWGGFNQNQICKVSNLSTNMRVWKLQGTESRHVTGYQI